MDELLVTDADYQIERGEPVIILRTVDEDGQCNFLKKRGFKPYFYVKKSEYGELDKHDKEVHKTIDGQEVLKKYTKKPSDVSDLRDEYSITWESDIRFPIRFLVDRGIKSGIKINDDKELEPTDIGVNEITPTKMFLDIETTTTKETVNLDPDKNEVRIVSIVVRYINENKGTDKEFVFTDESEYKLLNNFIDCVIDHNPDMLLAWNSYFDMGTIFNNCKKLGVDIERMSPLRTVYKRGHGDNREVVCKGRKVIDLMYAYDRFYTNKNLETKALEPVCEDEIGIEQSYFDYDKLLEENWREHIEEIVEYNKVDVERMVKLDKELRIINHFEELRRTTGCMFKQAYRTSGFVDVLMLRAFKNKYVLPRSRKKKKSDDDGKKFKGGLVKLMSEAGVYNWVAVLDFHAHYPTGIKNFNMSPETLVEDEYDGDVYKLETELGFVKFKQEPRGILPSIFDEMEEHRNELKAKRDKYDKGTDEWEYYNSRQYSRKQIINSIFGYFGYAGSRLYIPKLAAAVTRAGRKYIEDTIDYVEDNFTVETHYSDSLDYNRKIIVKNDDGIDIVKIGKFVEEYDCKKYETLAMNTDNGKVKFEKIKQGISHRYDYSKKGKLLEFNTTRGKTVVTPQHSVYKLVDGKPRLVDAKELEIGDKLVSSKELPNFVLYNIGDSIDLSKIDYGIKNDEMMGYKVDNLYSYLNEVCPFCGKDKPKKHHLYVKHNRDKVKLDDIDNRHKYIGCENSGSGKFYRNIELDEELAWILGYYCADGSASVDDKKMLSFGSQNIEYIKRVKKYFDEWLERDSKIIEDIDKRTYNKMYYYRIQNIGVTYLFVYGFDCGHKSTSKKVPKIILNSGKKLKKSFLDGYMSGDGSIVKEHDDRYVSNFKRATTKSEELAIGLNYIFKSLNEYDDINQVLWSYRKDKKGIIDLRTVKDDVDINGAKIREIKKVEPKKDYVYDIEVENEHNFMDAEGNLLVHNTDSIFFSVDAENKEKAVEKAKDIEEGINNFWEKVSQENNLYGRPDIECEKIYKSIFFKGGTKKRYAGLKRWEEGKFCDEISVSGFEIVRTDESKPTKDAQQGLFEIILRENDFQKMHEHLTDVIDKLKNAEKPRNMAKPSPIRMKPEEYVRPYAVHGIIWSNKNLGKEFGITETKPYIIHIDSLPEGYSDVLYIPKEKGGKDIRRHIERIALSADDDLDDWKKHIDYDTHIEKLVKDKVQPILEAIGYSYSEVINNQKQSSMDQWM